MIRQGLEHPGKARPRVIKIKPGKAAVAFAHRDKVPLKKTELHLLFSRNSYPAIRTLPPNVIVKKNNVPTLESLNV